MEYPFTINNIRELEKHTQENINVYTEIICPTQEARIQESPSKTVISETVRQNEDLQKEVKEEDEEIKQLQIMDAEGKKMVEYANAFLEKKSKNEQAESSSKGKTFEEQIKHAIKISKHMKCLGCKIEELDTMKAVDVRLHIQNFGLVSIEPEDKVCITKEDIDKFNTDRLSNDFKAAIFWSKSAKLHSHVINDKRNDEEVVVSIDGDVMYVCSDDINNTILLIYVFICTLMVSKAAGTSSNETLVNMIRRMFEMLTNHYTVFQKMKKEVQELDKMMLNDIETISHLMTQIKENGMPYYKVVWKKPEVWVNANELSECNSLFKHDDNRITTEKEDNRDGEEKPVCANHEAEDKCFERLHKKVLKRNKLPEWLLEEDEVKKKLRAFEETCCNIPYDKEATNKHTIIMKELETILGCLYLEYTGSSYDGLKTSIGGLEYDVMFVMDGKDLKSNAVKGHDGFFNLQITDSNSKLSDYTSDGETLSPKIMLSRFFGTIHKFLNSKYKDSIKVRQHGPAIQIDVSRVESKEVWFRVDLVICYQVKYKGESCRFIGKPVDDSEELSNTWRQSFSDEEKKILKGIDEGNECRRKATRIVKGIFKTDTLLNNIPSYHLKTVLLHISDKMKDESISWGNKDVNERVFNILAIIKGYIEENNLPNYFVPNMNLLKNLKPEVLDYIKSRLGSIMSSKDKFLKLIQSNL